MGISCTFPKTERLSNHTAIRKVFNKGKAEFLYPFKLLYYSEEASSQKLPSILFSVPKKNFKRAVHRNYIRRQLKEIYRQHKDSIFTSSSETIPSLIAVIYIGKEFISFLVLQQKLILILNRLKSAR